MGRSNDMSDWLIRLKQKTTFLNSKKKTQIRSDIIISSNSTLQCNLIEGPFIYKVTSVSVLGDLWSHHKNTCSLEEGLEIKILKANGRAKEKRMCLKEK